MDLYNLLGKQVEVEIYRKKYSTKDHIRVYSGKLTDIGGTMICLERKDGRYHWVPKPNMYRDKIKEVK